MLRIVEDLTVTPIICMFEVFFIRFVAITVVPNQIDTGTGRIPLETLPTSTDR